MRVNFIESPAIFSHFLLYVFLTYIKHISIVFSYNAEND